MGKASKLLTILVTDPALMETDEVKDLIAKGHTVHVDTGAQEWQPEPLSTYDLIMGANAWQMPPDLVKYIPLAVKAARDRKYGQPGVKEKHDSTGSGEGGSDAKPKRTSRATKATPSQSVE